MTEILKSLEAILSQGYNPSNIFNDWLDLMLFAMQRDDEPYLDIVKKYKNDNEIGKREIDYFAKAFADLQIEMQKTNDDILGQIYMQWNQSTKFRGQFFTPSHVAGMMAKMLNPKGRILDPCCGSGILLIEAIKTMTNEELDKAVIVGQDIDLTCVKMCALNLLFFNVNGFVVWGDSLMMECKKAYETKRSYLGGSIRELKEEVFEKFKDSYNPSLQKIIEEKSILQTQKSEQLTFF
jgi:type I restriction-modification system DNA methylase subunit